MKRTIAVFGGSFNPPGIHHRQIVEQLAGQFDSVVIVPCGPRPDKATNDHIPPTYRAAMADVSFTGIRGVEVDLFDLEQEVFTRTHELQRRYEPRGEVWHVVGGDLICGGSKCESVIHRRWENGSEMWEKLNFVVLSRPGIQLTKDDLPPKHRFIQIDSEGSSDAIRERIYHGEPLQDLVPQQLAGYIDRHGLYRGSIPARATRVKLDNPRLLIIPDQRNPRALEWAKKLERYSCPEDPNMIVAIGGDGTMLPVIHNNWRKRLPFFGINSGHLGFLLNDAKYLTDDKLPPEIIFRQMPMLYVEMQRSDGSWINGLTFSDAWVERATGQTAWLEVKVDGRVRLPKLICDGALVSTAAGSTAYAHSMGATPLLADTPAWLLVGSNVMNPVRWKSALLSFDSQVEITALNPSKRPITGLMYGVPQGEIISMRVRVSRIATVELGFSPMHDMAEKIAQIQFPPPPAQ